MIATANPELMVRAFYEALSRAWGPQHWWPARTRFEVIVGAYLTQNTSWVNVERAICSLRRAGVLSISGVRNTPLRQLEQLVRSAGYFRQKAQRLKTFVDYLDARYGGSLTRMFARPTAELRAELLALNGVGPETADSILLYAGNHPVFVVDAYTRRIAARHGLLPENAPYEEIRQLFERALSESPVASGELRAAHIPARRDQSQVTTVISGAAHAPSPMSTARRPPVVQRFNEMHGLIVGAGKHHCFKAQAECAGCPLEPFLAGCR